MNDKKQPQSVLCIEDEHFISELYQRAMQKVGMNVKVVTDGVTGLKEAQTNTYDIILLDLMLPEMTGMDVLRALRQPGSPTFQSKVIITTNLDVQEDDKKDLEKMADGYLIKAEITPKQLVEFIQNTDL